MKRLTLLLPLLLVGCDVQSLPDVRQSQYQPQQTRATEIARPAGRFDMRVVDEFHDSNAYHDKRSIFIITDRKTHKEYLGVEGVGVTDLSDERNQDDDDDNAAAANAATMSAAVAIQ
ncbi:TPA: hypothetical protein I9Y37_001932 [Citrobacter freundii]|nr:hypothetical protein [Citrobacter freundii]HAT3963907.1 hypothetical protein [Citrobacter freundii]